MTADTLQFALKNCTEGDSIEIEYRSGVERVVRAGIFLRHDPEGLLFESDGSWEYIQCTDLLRLRVGRNHQPSGREIGIQVQTPETQPAHARTNAAESTEVSAASPTSPVETSASAKDAPRPELIPPNQVIDGRFPSDGHLAASATQRHEPPTEIPRDSEPREIHDAEPARSTGSPQQKSSRTDSLIGSDEIPRDELRRKLGSLQAEFKAGILGSALKPSNPFTAFPAEEIANLCYTDRRELTSRWDSCRQQIPNALASPERWRVDRLIYEYLQIAKAFGFWRARFNAGCLYLRISDSQKAIECFGQAAQEGVDLSCYWNLAVASLSARDLGTALHALTEYFLQSSIESNLPAWYKLAQIGCELGSPIFLTRVSEAAGRNSRQADASWLLRTAAFLLATSSAEDGSIECLMILKSMDKDQPDWNCIQDCFNQWIRKGTPVPLGLPIYQDDASDIISRRAPKGPSSDRPISASPGSATAGPSSRIQADGPIVRAEKLAQQKQYGLAIAELRQVARDDPHHDRARKLEQEYVAKERTRTLPGGTGPFALAVKSARQGRKDEAERYFKDALRSGDNWETALKEYALFLSRFRRHAEGINLLIENKHRIRHQEPFLQVLVSICHSAHRFQEGIQYSQQLERIVPTRKRRGVLKRRAFLYLQLKEFAKAEATLKDLLSVAPADQTARDLLHSLTVAEQTGEYADVTELATVMFTEAHTHVSAFLQYYLERCEYTGLSAATKASGEYTANDAEQLHKQAVEMGVDRPKERAAYYLTAARLLQDLGGLEDVPREYLRNYCAAMGDAIIADKGSILREVPRSFYAEAFLVAQDWAVTAHRAGQMLVKLTQYIMLYYAEAPQLLAPELPSIESALKHSLSVDGTDTTVIEALLYLSTLNAEVGTTLLQRMFRHPELLRRTMSLCQKLLNIDGNLPTDHRDCAALWNRGMEVTRRRVQSSIEHLRYLISQAEMLDSLPSQMHRLQSLDQLLIERLDRKRAGDVLAVLEKVVDYSQQRRYLEKDSLANSIKNSIRDLVEQIEAAPTKMSLEYLRPYLLSVAQTVEQHFEEVNQRAEPETLETEILDSYQSDERNRQIECLITIRNRPEKSPASKLYFELLDSDDYLIPGGEHRLSVSDALRESEHKTFPIILHITEKAHSAGFVKLHYRLSYVTRRGNKIETPRLNQPITLQRGEFSQIPNKYSPWVKSGAVLDENMFKGRDELIDRLIGLLADTRFTRSVVIYGQKRAGKSSILHHLKRRLGLPAIAVDLSLIDLGEVVTSAAFLHCIMHNVNRRLVSLNQDGHYTEPPAPPKFSELGPNSGPLFHEYMETVTRYINRNFPNGRLVLLIDEFTFLYRSIRGGSISRDFMAGWKGVLEKGYFSSVLAGQQNMRQFMLDFPNELQVADPLYVGYLDDKAAQELAEDPILTPTGESRYLGQALPMLLDLTARSPFYIQIFCQQLVDYMNEKRKQKVTDWDIACVRDSLLRGHHRLGRETFDNLLTVDERFDSFPLDVVEQVLRVVAASTRRDDFCDPLRALATVRIAEPQRVLSELESRDVLERDGARYRIRVGLFKDWLLSTLPQEPVP